MKWGEGQEGANKAGRQKGSYGGRIRALQCLDNILAKRKSQAALTRALEDELHSNPLGFFRTIVMPLLPKEAKLSLDHDGVLEWKSMIAPIAPVAVDAPPTGEVMDGSAVETDRGNR